MDKATTIQMEHGIHLKNRNDMHITGVTDVGRFDEKAVQMVTVEGGLTVCGEQLHIVQLHLETGDLYLGGRVDSMVYSAKPSGRGALRRLFR